MAFFVAKCPDCASNQFSDWMIVMNYIVIEKILTTNITIFCALQVFPRHLGFSV